MKRKHWIPAVFLVLILGFLTLKVTGLSTDIMSLYGSGAYNNIDMFRIDQSGNLYLTNSSAYNGVTMSPAGETTLYSGDLNLTGGAVQPSTNTASSMPGLIVNVYNASSTAMSQGTLICISSAGAGTGYGYSAEGNFYSVLATNTILGVADAAISGQSYGKMRIAGYALVLTSGTVNVGDLLVSSDVKTSFGYAGVMSTVYTSMSSSGNIVGIALTKGVTAGGLTLVKLKL